MFTIRYKGFYIHGYTNKPECRVLLIAYNERSIVFKSIRAAKMGISRYINKGLSND